jgi:predicted neutral ceramidase superfamily lipid hydrolase
VTMWVIIAISTFAYFIAGMATAVLVIIVNGEPRPNNYDQIFINVMFWPIWFVVYVPILVARWIKACRQASREKPRVFSEYDEI